jgi:NAD(P)H-quinone oxidoreductase subunit 4
MVGTGLTAVYFLLMVNRVFFGRLPDYLQDLPRVKWSELAPAVVLSLLIVVLGIQPNWLVRWSEPEIGFLLVPPQPDPVVSQIEADPIARSIPQSTLPTLATPATLVTSL